MLPNAKIKKLNKIKPVVQKPYLFWFVANKDYEYFSKMTRYSLKKYCKLPYEIKILSDFNDRDHIDMSNKATGTKYKWQNLKPFIVDVIDVTKYRYLVYIDSDVLINSEKFNDIIVDYCNTQKIVVQKDSLSVAKNNTVTGIKNELSNIELLKYSDAKICTGFCALPANSIGFKLLNDWKDLIILNPQQIDQYHYNLALLRGNYDFVEDENIKFFRSKNFRNKKSSSTMLHFANGATGTMIKYFNSFLL